MFVEALLTREDLHTLLSEALPLTVRVGDPGSGHSIALCDLGEVTLVPDVGLRVTCKARVHWPVIGIEVPIILHSLVVLLTPSVRPGPQGDVLAFQPSVESVDLAGVPGAIDHGIVKVINEKLAESPPGLSWDFSDLLTHLLRLPSMLEQLDSFAIRAAWGKIKITDDAFVLAVSLHTALLRRHEEVPAEYVPLTATSEPRISLPKVEQPGADSGPLFAAGVFGLAAGAAYYGLRAALGSRW